MEFSGIYVVKFDRTADRAGNPVDWVEISNRDNLGSNGHAVVTTRHRVKSLRPDMEGFSHLNPATVDAKRRAMNVVWNVVGPAYDAWLAGNEMPTDGTPLASWGGITPDRAAAFAAAGFKSVEEIASASDERIGRVKLPDARRVALSAKEWLKGRDTATLAAELAELKALLASNGIEATKAAIAPSTVGSTAEDEFDDFEEASPEPEKRTRTRTRAKAGA